jgi:hypothetical protein
VTTIENERTHYVVPGSHPQADVILYRSHGNLLHASTRTAPDGPWTTPPAITNITDDVSNINAGVLPDGRVFLVSNAMLNIFRDPLFISLSSDGWHFDATRVVASCEQDVFVAPDQPWGCLYRYPGGAKEGGVQVNIRFQVPFLSVTVLIPSLIDASPSRFSYVQYPQALVCATGHRTHSKDIYCVYQPPCNCR